MKRINAGPGRTGDRMARMDHTLLFQEWTWDSRGEYIDDRGKSIPFEGTVKTFHENHLWFHEGRMTLTPAGGPPVSFENRYEIIPFEKGKTATSWTTLNPDIGILAGRFVIVNEAILSFCRSENGLFTGCETLVRIDSETYKNWGTLFREKERISSWSLRLKR